MTEKLPSPEAPCPWMRLRSSGRWSQRCGQRARGAAQGSKGNKLAVLVAQIIVARL